MESVVRIFLLIILLAGKLIFQSSVLATEITFHGTLIEPPKCTINDSNQIEIDFGERLGVNKIDGVNYRMPVNYQIVCDDYGSGWSMSLLLQGTGADFDSDALLTSNPDLGVRIYQNDVPLSPNIALGIDLAKPPRLEAVPVKRAGATLTEGGFEAWATLEAKYQ